jgi:menaquinone-dependent protoporphyrinogen oxidase
LATEGIFDDTSRFFFYCRVTARFAVSPAKGPAFFYLFQLTPAVPPHYLLTKGGIMKSLIIYATKTGYVTECVEKLAGLLTGEVDKINLAGRPPKIDPSQYDRIMIGGSIRAGRIQKVVRKFCAAHTPLLVTKKIGLFIACLAKPEETAKYFDDNFPRSLVVQASAKACFGGAAYYERMSPLERLIIKKISGQPESFSKPNEAGIKQFAQAMK